MRRVRSRWGVGDSTFVVCRRQGCCGRRRDAVRSPASRDQPPCERRLGDLNVRGSSGLMSWRLRLTTSAACDLAEWRTRYADGKRSHASSWGSEVAARSKVTDGLARLEAASTMPATSLDARGAELLLFEVLTERQDTHPLRRWPTCRSANGVRSPPESSPPSSTGPLPPATNR